MIFRRRWLQFSLRTYLLVMIAVAVACALVLPAWRRKNEERDAVAILNGGGYWVFYDYEVDETNYKIADGHPAAPAWLRELVGEDRFGSPALVERGGDPSANGALEQLRKLKTLRAARLYELTARDKVFEVVHDLPQLTELWLDGKLWLESDEREFDFRELETCEPITNVKTLKVFRIESGPQLCQQIARKLPALDTVALYCWRERPTQLESAIGVRALRRLPNLRGLTIEPAEYPEPGMTEITGFDRLQTLDVTFYASDDCPRVRVAECPELRTLNLFVLSSQGKPSLVLDALPSLRHLVVRNIDRLEVDGSFRLRSLDVSRCGGDSGYWVNFARAVQLRELEYSSDNASSLPSVLQGLRDVPTLRMLELPGWSLGDDELRLISSLTQLTELDLGSHVEIEDASFRQLDQLTNFKRLKLNEKNVTAETIAHLKAAIPGLECTSVGPAPVVPFFGNGYGSSGFSKGSGFGGQ